MYPTFFNTRKSAKKFITDTDATLTLYVREDDYDSSLPNQWAVAGYPCEELGNGWIEYEQPTHKSGTAPDTSLFLGDARRGWLKGQGGIQPTITRLIDAAMK